jgi:hypothetical protein
LCNEIGSAGKVAAGSGDDVHREPRVGAYGVREKRRLGINHAAGDATHLDDDSLLDAGFGLALHHAFRERG